MSESPESRLKRLKIRAWRRGTKEMDLVLGPYADARLATMDTRALDAFEALLDEHDQDLMRWMLGQTTGPAEHAPLIAELTGFAATRFRDGV